MKYTEASFWQEVGPIYGLFKITLLNGHVGHRTDQPLFMMIFVWFALFVGVDLGI